MGAIPVHHTATTESDWDGPAVEAAMPDKDKAAYRYCYAWVDSSGDPEAKSSYKMPHHRTKGGPAVLDGVRNALARLSNTDIPSGDDAGVKAHLEAHLKDAKPKAEQKSATGGHNREGTAAVPGTIDELITQIEVELETAKKRRDKAMIEAKSIIASASQESRSHLSADEDARVTELFLAKDSAKAAIDGIQVKLANAQKIKAEDMIDRAAQSEVTPTKAPRPAYDEVARVGREERTYHAGWDRKGSMFLRDVIHQHLFNDVGANTRLSRHMAEEKVERHQYLERAVGTGAFTGLTVPQYLTDMYAPAIAALRPFADICNQHDLPVSGMTVNISRITGPSGVALQAAEGDAVQETNMDDTLLTEAVLTASGQQTISRQAIDRGTGIEEVIMDDLFRRYATSLDSTLINQTVTGLDAISNVVTYADANPTGTELWPKILQGASNTEAALLGFARPDAVIMHSRRWYWLQGQLSSQWPLFGQPGINGVRGGENYAAQYGSGARGVMPNGMVAVIDNNVSTTLSSNQDAIYIVATDECHLWSDPAAPVFLRCEQPAAATLGVLLVLYGYFAYSLRRYQNAMSKVSGSGMVAPVF